MKKFNKYYKLIAIIYLLIIMIFIPLIKYWAFRFDEISYLKTYGVLTNDFESVETDAFFSDDGNIALIGKLEELLIKMRRLDIKSKNNKLHNYEEYYENLIILRNKLDSWSDLSDDERRIYRAKVIYDIILYNNQISK